MQLGIRAIIGMVIMIVVALLLFPLVQDSVGPMVTDNYSGDGENATTSGATKTLLEQVPLFYILAIALGVIGTVLVASKGLA